MRVAVVQFAAGAVKSANLARLRELVSRAAEDGAELIVAPEAAMLPSADPKTPWLRLPRPSAARSSQVWARSRPPGT